MGKTYTEVHAGLTPSEEEQMIAILSGKCPHNQGWQYAGHSHKDDAYACAICGEFFYI